MVASGPEAPPPGPAGAIIAANSHTHISKGGTKTRLRSRQCVPAANAIAATSHSPAVPDGAAQLRVWHAEQLVDLPRKNLQVQPTPVLDTMQLSVVPRPRLPEALRETREEIGLAEEYTSLAGYLHDHMVISGYVVTPVVGLVTPGFALRIDTFEVEEVFEPPLAFLMDPANHRHHEFEFGSEHRRFLSMPWQGVDASGQARESAARGRPRWVDAVTR